MFKVKYKKHQNDDNNVILVFLFLTFNIFLKMFWEVVNLHLATWQNALMKSSQIVNIQSHWSSFKGIWKVYIRSTMQLYEQVCE